MSDQQKLVDLEKQLAQVQDESAQQLLKKDDLIAELKNEIDPYKSQIKSLLTEIEKIQKEQITE